MADEQKRCDVLAARQRRCQRLTLVILSIAAAGVLTILPQRSQGGDPVRIVDGLSSPVAVASDPQASPFAATADGQIRHVVPPNLSDLLVKTGAPAGLAFDAASNLYVADTARRAILKVTPWGELSVFTDTCSGRALSRPARVTVGPDNTLYFGDAGAARVCRTDESGKAAVIASDLNAAGGLAFGVIANSLFAAGSEGIVWKLSPDGKQRSVFAKLDGEGRAGGIAIDDAGNVYVGRDGGSRVSVFSAEGTLAREMPVPARRVTDLAFAGATLSDLYVAAVDGGLYRIPAGRRCQHLPWESDPALAITEPVDGTILNHNDGDESNGALLINVKGYSRIPGPVRVNGVAVPVRNGVFETKLALRDRKTMVRAEAAGTESRVAVLWDRNSFRRYRVSTDDNIWFLRDIARHSSTYRSIFENPYLGFWREMHARYGTKVHFNIYYETDGFNLSQMPDRFRPEWQRNSDWIRLSFHARANDPDRPYLHASAEKIRADYRLVTREIERFAGRELLSPFTTVHWGVLPRDAARALRQEGVRGMVAYFAEMNGLPHVCMYLPFAQWRYLMGRDYWWDTKEDIIMIRHDMVINLFSVDQIVPYLERIAADPHQSEVMELMIHEQYFYPDYIAYEPDYRKRVETAIQWATRRGYKPVLYSEGFVGAPERK